MFGFDQQAKKGSALRLAFFFCMEECMPKGPFLPSEFIATEFSTSADKADFGNTFLHLIESEWKETLFTTTFYTQRSNTFGT